MDFPSPARLPAAWNCYLAEALAVLRGKRGFVFSAEELDGAAGELHRLPARRLLRLEETVRNSRQRHDAQRSWEAYHRRPFQPDPPWPEDLLPLNSLESIGAERAEACLFVASCQRDGYLREYALRTFADRPGRLAMAAALIRCGDWADAVRRVAETLLRSMLERSPELLFDLLDLALSMRERERFDDVWNELVEPVLHAPRHAERLWRATQSDWAHMREWAYRASVVAGARTAAQVCVAALDDPHPRLAQAALTQAEAALTADELDRQLRLTRHRLPPALRRDALRLAARLETPSLRECLSDALFDRSTGPRRVAAYLLSERFGEDAARAWRNALDAGDSRRARIALAALGECAQAEDEARLLPWLERGPSWLRLQALRGLIRGECAGLPDALARALRDADYRIAAEALDAYKRGCATLPPDALEQAWASRPAHRALFVAGADLLDKWRALDFLLSAAGEPHQAPIAHPLVAALNTWANVGRYRFGSVAEASPRRLRELLDRAAAQLPSDLRRELASLIPQ